MPTLLINMNYYLGEFKKLIFDTIFPKKCIACRKEGSYICDNCFAYIDLTKKQQCPKCKNDSHQGSYCSSCQSRSLDGLFVMADFDDPILSQAIHCFKYNFISDLGSALAEIYKTNDELGQFVNSYKKNIAVAAVPLHKKRELHRGFNQSEILAERFAHMNNLVHIPKLITRIRNTVSQVEIGDASSRKLNVKDAFNIDNFNLVKGKRVIIVDDVYTTGATLTECSRALKQGKPEGINGLVLARGKTS